LSATFFKKNLIQLAMGSQIKIEDDLQEYVWKTLNLAWVVFFIVMGLLNVYVAYQFSEDTWVNFKLFGSMGLMLVFIIAQGVWLNRFIVQEE